MNLIETLIDTETFDICSPYNRRSVRNDYAVSLLEKMYEVFNSSVVLDNMLRSEFSKDSNKYAREFLRSLKGLGELMGIDLLKVVRSYDVDDDPRFLKDDFRHNLAMLQGVLNTYVLSDNYNLTKDDFERPFFMIVYSLFYSNDHLDISKGMETIEDEYLSKVSKVKLEDNRYVDVERFLKTLIIDSEDVKTHIEKLNPVDNFKLQDGCVYFSNAGGIYLVDKSIIYKLNSLHWSAVSNFNRLTTCLYRVGQLMKKEEPKNNGLDRFELDNVLKLSVKNLSERGNYRFRVANEFHNVFK